MIRIEKDYIITNFGKLCVSNGLKIKNAISVELDVIEPSLICLGNAETTKVVAVGNYRKEYILKVFRKVVDECGNS